MDRAFSAGRLLLILLFTLAITPTAQAVVGPVVLQNDHVLLEVSPANGRLLRIQHKAGGIDLRLPPRLAENFRLVVLMPDKKAAFILGKDQKLTDARISGSILSMKWDGPLKDAEGGEHNISVRMDIEAAAESLEFRFDLENNSPYKVKEVWYPFAGGLSRFAKDAVFWAPTSNPSIKKVGFPFGGLSLGYPGHLNMSYICMESASSGRSIYFSSQDKIARYKVYHFLELGADSNKDISYSIQHMPFTPAGGRFTGSPVVLRFIKGDHRSAGKIYREWFSDTFGLMDPDNCWIRKNSFFYMLMFKLPEGTINYTFKDIPRLAKACKDHGINAFKISGWHLGGHDNGYPHYVIDPELGTWEELEEGIRECHRLGMKVYFFVNYQAMMVDSDWYKNKLIKYREEKEDGGHTWLAGWGMGTLWARMGNPKLMTWADPAFPEYRRIIIDQFAKLAQIGGDGVHVDKMYPTSLDHNPRVPMSPDTATWEGAVKLTEEIMRECKRYNPDWAMSFETNWDRMLQFSSLTWWVGNMLVVRSVFPEHSETLALSAAYDYLGVNNAVRNGHTVMVAPRNFCESVDWEPFRGLADYIKEVKGIQDKLQDTVFLGEALGKEQVKLQASAAVDYNVFRNRKTGKRVCILTNSSMEPVKQTVEAFDDSSSGKVRVYTPFKKPRTVKLPGEIEIPAERIVFVEEL